jgi:hypothetical protein
MNNDLPIPFSDYLYVIPVEKQLVVGGKTLQTYGTVLAKGPDVCKKWSFLGISFGPTIIQLNDIVAFELQDKPEFISADGKVYNFVRERDCMTKLPTSFL